MTALVTALILAILASPIVYTQLTDKRIRRSIKPPGKRMVLEGATLHWQEYGEGPALLLLHGLGGNGGHFTAMVDSLATQYKVYILDRPGSGHSERVDDTLAQFDKQANLIARWMEANEITKATLVGHSMGGAVALNMAIHHSEKVAALALLCPLVAPMKESSGPLSHLFIPQAWRRKLIAKTIATPMLIANAKRHLGAIFSPQQPPANFALKYGGVLAAHSDAFYAAAGDIVAAQKSLYKQAEHYADIKCPVGILYGEKDNVLSPGYHMQFLAKSLPDCTQDVLPGQGHMIPITAPQECVTFINKMTSTLG